MSASVSAKTPISTSGINDLKTFCRNLKAINDLPQLPKLPHPSLEVNTQVGDKCYVRGLPVSTAFDRWVCGKVLQITRNFRFRDGMISDKFTVEFTDPSDPDEPRRGVFFRRWNEVCDLNQDKTKIPYMTPELLMDLLQTRMVWTPILVNSENNDVLRSTFSGVMWTPAFIEDIVTNGASTLFDVKFIHILGGMTATRPTRVRFGTPIYDAFRSVSQRPFEKSIAQIVPFNLPLFPFTEADVERTIHIWGPQAGTNLDETLPRFWCSCNGGWRSEKCRQI